MRINRISLRGYRVFEDLLELELPSGLVGVYGANGAGKSYLIESIPWTLYGKTRNSVQDVRTSGSDTECFTEIEFAHEGHVYCVSRTLSARGLAKARVWLDGDLVSDGVKDTNRFVHSVLGMDIDSFKASVFAEQKQLDAFSESSPAERQRLVLSLLGVTPLDKARDMARADARMRLEQLKIARASLPDINLLYHERDQVMGDITLANDRVERTLVEVGRLGELAQAAERELKRFEVLRVRSDQVIAVGREKRRLLEELTKQAFRHDEVIVRLRDIDALLAESSLSESVVSDLEREVTKLMAAVESAAQLENASKELDLLLKKFGCSSAQELERLSGEITEKLGVSKNAYSVNRAVVRELELEIAALRVRSQVSRATMARLSELGSQSSCPTCGQELGNGFSSHVTEAREVLESQLEMLANKELEFRERKAELASAEIISSELSGQEANLERALFRASLLRSTIDKAGYDAAALAHLPDKLHVAKVELQRARDSYRERVRLIAEKRQIDKMLPELAEAKEACNRVGAELQALKGELSEIGFDSAAYRRQVEIARSKCDAAENAKMLLERERLARVQLLGKLDTAEALISQAQELQASVARLESGTAVLCRVSDYLSEFRRSMIASLGPRLARASTSLFSELTESEYDCLEVDADSWQLRISDFGHSHDLSRFSGSERDIANLAFRIAISEQIGIGFGQQIGLLVLDEIFGPLDDQRRFVMLGVLESLKARFNQVIVVTHGAEIKEQMPGAIEVVKLGRRRSTARVA